MKPSGQQAALIAVAAALLLSSVILVAFVLTAPGDNASSGPEPSGPAPQDATLSIQPLDAPAPLGLDGQGNPTQPAPTPTQPTQPAPSNSGLIITPPDALGLPSPLPPQPVAPTPQDAPPAAKPGDAAPIQRGAGDAAAKPAPDILGNAPTPAVPAGPHQPKPIDPPRPWKIKDMPRGL